MPSKLRGTILTLFIPVVLLVVVACPGVIIERISITFGPGGAIVSATGTFTCNSPTGEVLIYRWFFGDGNTAEGKTVTHAYQTAGDFLVECHIVTVDSVIIFKQTITIGPIIQNIAWSNNTSEEILSCPVDGPTPCSPTVLANAGTSGVDDPRGLMIVDDVLYWADTGDNTIRSCSITTTPCTSTVIADNTDSGVDAPNGIFVDGNRIYWANVGDNTLRSCLIGAVPCTSVTIHADTANSAITSGPVDVFVLEDFVFWSQGNNDVVAGCLTAAATCVFGSDIVIFADAVTGVVDSPRGIFISDGTLYWANEGDDEIRTCPIGVQCTSSIFADVGTSGVNFPNGVFIDDVGGDIYWVNTTSNIISRCPLNATTPCGTVGSELTDFADNATSGVSGPQYVWGY